MKKKQIMNMKIMKRKSTEEKKKKNAKTKSKKKPSESVLNRWPQNYCTSGLIE